MYNLTTDNITSNFQSVFDNLSHPSDDDFEPDDFELNDFEDLPLAGNELDLDGLTVFENIEIFNITNNTGDIIEKNINAIQSFNFIKLNDLLTEVGIFESFDDTLDTINNFNRGSLIKRDSFIKLWDKESVYLSNTDHKNRWNYRACYTINIIQKLNTIEVL